MIVKEPRRASDRSATSTSTRTSSRASRSRTRTSATTRTGRSRRSSSATSSRGLAAGAEAASVAACVAGDKVGQAGIESAFDALPARRARHARAARRLARRGRAVGRSSRAVPRRAHAVRLTLDLAAAAGGASARSLYGIQLARDSNCYGCWDANGGAIVALDPHDGSVLALASCADLQARASTPAASTTKTLAPQGLTPATARSEELSRRSTARSSGVYPPGSTFKPVTALAAMQEHLVSPYAPLPCTGSYTSPHDRAHQVFKNWDPYVNQPIDLPTALALSCDTYFYQLGDAFYGLPRERGHPLQAWASRFGFGRRDRDRRRPRVRRPAADARVAAEARSTTRQLDRLWKPGDSIQLAIGQKDLLVTPMQMARFYALIANGGKLVTPHVLLGVEQPATRQRRAVTRAAPAAAADRHRPGRARGRPRRPLEATHASFGTSTAVFGSFPVAIAGKTGHGREGRRSRVTASRAVQTSRGGAATGRTTTRRSSSARVIENGGHGGTAAAPAALKVFEQYFHEKAPSIGAIRDSD